MKVSWLRHLIIGAGNMGRRHGRILTSLGDRVTYVDILWKPNREIKLYDSLLLCTPAETHAGLIKELEPYRKPLFVEKPVITSPPAIIYRGAPSMVAMNWKWCKHLKNIKELVVCYPWNSNHSKLDLMHFWHRFERHRYLKVFYLPRIISLISMGQKSFTLVNSEKKETFVRRGMKLHQIHTLTQCRMFHLQMKFWRKVVKGEEPPINPIDEASRDTIKLMELISEH